jgi:hypothetical protein
MEKETLEKFYWGRVKVNLTSSPSSPSTSFLEKKDPNDFLT